MKRYSETLEVLHSSSSRERLTAGKHKTRNHRLSCNCDTGLFLRTTLENETSGLS